jgi:hypothetical protein
MHRFFVAVLHAASAYGSTPSLDFTWNSVIEGNDVPLFTVQTCMTVMVLQYIQIIVVETRQKPGAGPGCEKQL